MLRTFISPLLTHRGLPDREPSHSNDIEATQGSGGDTALDALALSMQRNIADLKVATDVQSRLKLLLDTKQILHDEPSSKDTFRDSDGFLVVLHVLSTLSLPLEDNASKSVSVDEVLSCMQCTFHVISEAVQDHTENAKYLKENIGYDALSEATQGLVKNTHTSDSVLGLLLFLAFQDSTLCSLFEILHPISDIAIMDVRLSDFTSRLGQICLPGVFKVLWNSLCLLMINDSLLRYITYKLLDHIITISQWNHAILYDIGPVEILLRSFLGGESRINATGKEYRILQKLLKRLFDMCATTNDARALFQSVIKSHATLDMDVLEIIRSGMKSRWPEHICLDSDGSLSMTAENIKSLPHSGFTVMVWLWMEKLPSHRHSIFSIQLGTTAVVNLCVLSDGRLAFQSTSHQDTMTFSKVQLSTSRWCHVALVHHAHKAAAPGIRVFVDGVLSDSLHTTYPNVVGSPCTYAFGDRCGGSTMNWCIASSYFLSVPLDDDLPRFIHHLGPRYSGHFQDRNLIRFLTYEASTSLNMYLSTQMSKGTTTEMTTLRRAVKYGIPINESSIVFSLTPSNFVTEATWNLDACSKPELPGFVIEGGVLVVNARPLDCTLWKIGGVALIMRLVELAKTSHELSRALGAFCDSLRNSWQNSEDMEQLHGYDVLVKVLRSKSHLINITSFEIIFEFLGLNFRSPDHSTIVNTVAYRAIALDFELWSQTNVEVQRVHIEHFAFLTRASRFRKFNVKHRLLKMGIVRRLLFVLQLGCYQSDMTPFVINALFTVAQSSFSADDAIKPIASYLAANLHDGRNANTSPRSLASRCASQRQQVSEQVLEVLVSTLRIPTLYAKFTTVLPMHRICLLFLGENPTPSIASQVLLIIGISLNTSLSFSRNFDSVHGWAVLKAVIPNVWDRNVHKAVFDVLHGRVTKEITTASPDTAIVCPDLVPVIFTAVKKALDSTILPSGTTSEDLECSTKTTAELLLRDLTNLYSSSVSFRRVFKSQLVSHVLIETLESGLSAKALLSVSVLDSLIHFSTLVATDNIVSNNVRNKIFTILQSQGGEEKLPKELLSSNMLQHGFTPRRSTSDRFPEEQSVVKVVSKSEQWRNTISVSERKRFRKTVLYLHEHHRQVTHYNQWVLVLSSERSLWPSTMDRSWRLDETEGPYRIRKKLEPVDEACHDGISSGVRRMNDFPEFDTDLASLRPNESVSWSESHETSSQDLNDERQLAEDVLEDKHRRVRHELEPGDVIEAVSTVARVAGVDSSPGLLILGRTHIYMLDGLVEGDDGEVIDAHDAPKRLLFIPGSIVELNGPQRAQRWTFDQLLSFSDRMFLFRDVGLELFFKDSRSILIVFLDKPQRHAASQRLQAIVDNRELNDGAATGSVLHWTPILGRVGARVVANFRAGELLEAQRKWQNREISNFSYLSILNQVSCRTPKDATQYPVFPWVLQDYQSEILDLSLSSSFRDLTKPMGSLSNNRREAALSRYMNLKSVDEEPFHYGTHFSSSMIVCHFMIRLAPYTNMFKTLQGGDWDIPDRLFTDIARTFHSASNDDRGDVRELIPEFFTSPEFLENLSNLDFGVQQSTGDKIHDVKLPPWAKGDPLLFVVLNRRALESDYVSENLPAWIDLVWGCKQRDPASMNVFHPLSYEGSVDLDTITDDLEREAKVGIIHNFGQTPRKLFNAPHPARNLQGSLTLPVNVFRGIEEDTLLLSQENKPVSEIGAPVYTIAVDPNIGKLYSSHFGILQVPSHPHEQVQWGMANGQRNRDGSLRLLVNGKITQVIESVVCTCAVFADADTLATGSSDYAIRLWQLTWDRPNGGKGVSTNMTMTHTMRVHTAEVSCITASRSWAMVVSGSRDGSAAVWDLNRGTYTKSIWHRQHGDGSTDCEVHLVAINESTGYIATCSRTQLCLHTINGRPITSMDLHSLSPSRSLCPPITSLAFHEREYSRLGVLATGGPDGEITLRTWNADGTPAGKRAQWEFVTITTLKHRSLAGGRRSTMPVITALKFIGQSLAAGEDTGKTYLWTLSS